ncbi:MAG: hypothetical protein J5705_04735 [Bacteroidaceae bacterium]|nr:hypothetical protein [Bacteroidaceae bacterium]
MEEEKNITQREQLWIITTAIILAGITANYSTVSPSSSHIIVAKGVARDILANILDEKKL